MKERRIAVKASHSFLQGICVFRGSFLEDLILSKEDVVSKFLADSVREEVMESNFGYRNSYRGDLEGLCLMIVSRISEKLNTIKQ